MYLVEVVQLSGLKKCRVRSPDYDRAADVFLVAKAERCRGIFMFRVSTGERVLLKYLVKTRSAVVPEEERSSSDVEEEVSD